MRLREETEFKPKPMVTIGDHPILWHIMKIYASYGYKEFILCLGYKGEVIKDYFLNYAKMNSSFTISLSGKRGIIFHNSHHQEDWSVTLADTGQSSMTGARLKKVAHFIEGDSFFMTYGDGVSNVNITDLLSFHKSHGKAATVTGTLPPSRFGDLEVDDNAQVKSFSEKPQVHSGGIINGGFFVLDKRVIDFIPDDDGCPFERQPMEDLAEAGELMLYKHDGFWQCMDTIRDRQLLNNLWKAGHPPWKVW